MGRRGPAPKPTALKRLEGQPPSLVGGPEPVPRDGLPTAPEWLDPDARAVWDRVLDELAAMKLACAPDAEALTAYCTAVVNHARAQQILDREGVVIRGERGNVRNPAHAVAVAEATAIVRLAREFGFTPSARAGMRAPKASEPQRKAERLIA